jgi:hypothetical protein
MLNDPDTWALIFKTERDLAARRAARRAKLDPSPSLGLSSAAAILAWIVRPFRRGVPRRRGGDGAMLAAQSRAERHAHSPGSPSTDGSS